MGNPTGRYWKKVLETCSNATIWYLGILQLGPDDDRILHLVHLPAKYEGVDVFFQYAKVAKPMEMQGVCIPIFLHQCF